MDSKVMRRLSYGLYVLTAKDKDSDNGCIINTAMQVTSGPDRISITVNRQNRTHDMVRASGKFNISMISREASFDLFKTFGFQSGKNVNKFETFKDCDRAANGILYITGQTNGFLSGSVMQEIDLGTHTLFIADVTDGKVLSESPSVTYEYYQKNIKPAPEKKKTGYVCRICGYIYEGEPLPKDFICPWCRHGAADFEKL